MRKLSSESSNHNLPVLDRGGRVEGCVQHCGQGEGEEGGQGHHRGQRGHDDDDERRPELR